MTTVVGVADQFLILIAITLLFSILSIAWHKSITLSILTTTCWMFSAIANFAVGDQTSPLTTTLSYIALAFTLIFSTRTVLMVADLLAEKKRKKYDVVFE